MSARPTTYSKRAAYAVATIIAALLALPGVAAAAVTIQRVDGNPNCASVGAGLRELKLEPVNSRTLSDGKLIVSTDVKGRFFDWTADRGVDVVIVKGGPNASIYRYSPEATGGQGLSAPMNGNQPYGLSHISFCWDEDPPPPPPCTPGGPQTMPDGTPCTPPPPCTPGGSQTKPDGTPCTPPPPCTPGGSQTKPDGKPCNPPGPCTPGGPQTMPDGKSCTPPPPCTPGGPQTMPDGRPCTPPPPPNNPPVQTTPPTLPTSPIQTTEPSETESPTSSSIPPIITREPTGGSTFTQTPG